MSGMNIVRFPRTETCYTCTTCNRHLTDKSFLTVKDPWVLPKERDRTSECRVCDEIRLYATNWGERVLILGGDGLLGHVTPPACRSTLSR